MSGPTVILALLAVLVFVGLLLEEVFRRTGIPDVLVLLALGLAASATGVIGVEDLRGIDRVFTTAALVLILFEGAVRLRLADLKAALGGGLLLTFGSFFVSATIVGLVATLLFDMRPLAGLLLGTILGGTSSAVVIPIVQNLKMKQDTRTVLTLESALTDVFCIVFALALTGALSAGKVELDRIGMGLFYGFFGALALGAAAGIAWAVGLRTLRQHRASLIAIGAAVLLVYALAEGAGTFGAIACLSFGIVLGNVKDLAGKRPIASELELPPGELLFLGEVAFLFKILFFVYLGVALNLSGYEPILFGGLATLAVYFSRPFVVRLALRPATTPRRDAVIASALAPKGLAAAVLAGLPRQAGIAEGATIESAVFGAVLLSISGSAALVFAIDRPFVANAYGRLFKRYPESLEPAAAPEPAATPQEAPETARAPAGAEERAS